MVKWNVKGIVKEGYVGATRSRHIQKFRHCFVDPVKLEMLLKGT